MEQPPFVGDWVRKIKLGCGGFGIVTLWQNDKIPDSLAIKMCRPDIANKITPKQRERWSKEVQIMKSISHPNIVHTKRIPQILFEALKEYNISELPILSMEYCSKGSLRHVLNQTENCSGLSESEVRFIFEDILSAVAYLHNMKITHRDLKPDNIVLQILDPSLSPQSQFKNRTNQIVYKLIDLGYAKELDEKSISESFVGTLQYLAPEILLNRSYSNSVDYWSFGLVAFEIICGVRPFLPNMSPAQWLHQIQNKSSEIICIYQEIDEKKSIIHSNKIYSENFISSTFQTKLEKWFVVALEYDSKQRGYDKMKPMSQNSSLLDKKSVTFSDIESRRRDLKFFTLLNTALRLKIVTVFVIYTYQMLSYEIEDSLTVTDLLLKIQSDTKNEVLVSDMILVLPNREQQLINYEESANQLWINNFDAPMVHIWKRGQIISDQHIHLESSPDLIKRMCTFPKIKILGHAMKKFASDCLFYVKKEIQMYDTLIISCSSKIKIIQENIFNMTNKYNDMKSEWLVLSKNIKTTEDALNFDCEKLETICPNNDYCKSWTKSFENLCLKVNAVTYK
uniref:IkappaB kinase n=1 Tax=Xenopsylla cheopis TaxID=163159 RepID=A0A6M2DSM3_XENCH